MNISLVRYLSLLALHVALGAAEPAARPVDAAHDQSRTATGEGVARPEDDADGPSPEEVGAEGPSARITGATAKERCANLVTYLASKPPLNPDFPKDAMGFYAAKLVAGKDPDGTMAAIRHMVQHTVTSRIDPFNRHALMHGYLLCPERYPADVADGIRKEIARSGYTRGVGVSLNYGLMSDGSAFLASETWPDFRDQDGNDAARVRELTRKRLMYMLTSMVRQNCGEYEAPLYYGTDISPLRMLAEFTKDQEMRTVAQMSLEWMLINIGAHWHQGYYISAAGRAKYWASNNLSPDGPGATTAMAYLMYGGLRPANLGHMPYAFWLAHPGKAVPLDWLPAWYATLPVERTVHGAVQIPNHKVFVRKESWYTDGYGVASQRTDGSSAMSYQYKESRTTMLKWVSDQPASSFFVFQDNRRRPNETVANAFGYGENPYSQVMQHRGTLMGLYDVPESYGMWNLRAPFTTMGAILLRQERDGWVFCHGGRVLFAFRCLKPWKWGKSNTREHIDILTCQERRGGWVLETAPPRAFAGPDGTQGELTRFADAILTKVKIEADLPDDAAKTPRLTVRNLSGRRLDMTWKSPEQPYAKECRVDGIPLDYPSYPLIETTNLRQELDQPMTITLPKGKKRTYDFTAWKVMER